MKKVTFTKEQKRKVLEMAKALFPEYKHVNLSGDNIRFGFTKKNSISSVFAPQTHGYIPIFELLTVHFPRRMSKYKSGNESFAVLYSVGLIYLTNIEPSSIADYFYEKFKEIKVPYNAKQYAIQGIHELVSIENDYEQKRTFRAGTLLNKLNDNVKKESEHQNHETYINISVGGKY